MRCSADPGSCSAVVGAGFNACHGRTRQEQQFVLRKQLICTRAEFFVPAPQCGNFGLAQAGAPFQAIANRCLEVIEVAGVQPRRLRRLDGCKDLNCFSPPCRIDRAAFEPKRLKIANYFAEPFQHARFAQARRPQRLEHRPPHGRNCAGRCGPAAASPSQTNPWRHLQAAPAAAATQQPGRATPPPRQAAPPCWPRPSCPPTPLRWPRPAASSLPPWDRRTPARWSRSPRPPVVGAAVEVPPLLSAAGWLRIAQLAWVRWLVLGSAPLVGLGLMVAVWTAVSAIGHHPPEQVVTTQEDKTAAAGPSRPGAEAGTEAGAEAGARGDARAAGSPLAARGHNLGVQRVPRRSNWACSRKRRSPLACWIRSGRSPRAVLQSLGLPLDGVQRATWASSDLDIWPGAAW